MAVSLQSNRLLPLIGGGVVLMAVFMGLKSCAGEASSPGTTLTAVPQAPAPDGDTPAETIRTLTARVADMTARMEALSGENAELRRREQALRESVSQEVMTKLRAEQASRPDTAETLAPVMARLEALSERVSALAKPKEAAPETLVPGSDIPVGLGLEGEGALPAPTVPPAAMQLVWTEPLDAAVSEAPGAGLMGGARRLLGEARLQSPQSVADETVQNPPEPEPHYTVPRNATLIGSTGMTALIGRVPVDGQVRDPMPFKVIVGRENLATNGLTIPHVEGMIWSGTAVGDWTLACVSGRLESVTFLFDDGTIRTLSSDGDQKPLGWLSDAQGIPCVSGERITNAPAFLANRIGAGALETAAEGLAAAQTTTSVSAIGGTGTSSLTGDVGPFVAGKTLAGGGREVRGWLDARQGQSFDVVFVRPGAEVAIHVERELAIDYDLNGRKLNHVHAAFDPYRRARLD